MGGIVLEGHGKAPVLSQRDRVGALKFGAGIDNRLASSFLFGIVGSLNLHTDEAFCRLRVCLGSCHILFIARNGFSELGNVSRVLPQHQIFQSEPLI